MLKKLISSSELDVAAAYGGPKDLHIYRSINIPTRSIFVVGSKGKNKMQNMGTVWNERKDFTRSFSFLGFVWWLQRSLGLASKFSIPNAAVYFRFKTDSQTPGDQLQLKTDFLTDWFAPFFLNVNPALYSTSYLIYKTFMLFTIYLWVLADFTSILNFLVDSIMFQKFDSFPFLFVYKKLHPTVLPILSWIILNQVQISSNTCSPFFIDNL